HDIALPDWQAIHAILAQSAGKTVKVDYVTAEGVKATGSFAVTADNADPWLERVFYSAQFQCLPLAIRESVGNPIKAAAIGFKRAYESTMQTIQSIRHVVITHEVGTEKI